MQPLTSNFAGRLDLLAKIINQWYYVLTNSISFGDPDNAFLQDNVAGVYIDHTFAAANVEEVLLHNLQLIPSGYLLVSSVVACQVYQQKGTGTAWTNTQIYLKCTQATAVRLFILGH